MSEKNLVREQVGAAAGEFAARVGQRKLEGELLQRVVEGIVKVTQSEPLPEVRRPFEPAERERLQPAAVGTFEGDVHTVFDTSLVDTQDLADAQFGAAFDANGGVDGEGRHGLVAELYPQRS